MTGRAASDRTPRVGRFKKIKGKPPIIYFIGTPCGRYVKIGYTGDLYPRLSTIQTGYPEKLEVLFVIEGGKERETEIHLACSRDHQLGEWFKLSRRVRSLMAHLRKEAFDYDERLSGMLEKQRSEYKASLATRLATGDTNVR